MLAGAEAQTDEGLDLDHRGRVATRPSLLNPDYMAWWRSVLDDWFHNYELDGLLWFCETCNHMLYEEFFTLIDIEQDFPAVFARFYGSREARTCKACGHLNPAPARYAEATDTLASADRG